MSSSSSAAPAAAASTVVPSAGGAPAARSPRGADRLVEALLSEGVTTVFGLPGGASLPIHDALIASPIDHVLVRHEAAAGHAAEGYAKATGRVGVALVTSGPGATNLVTAIADAHADSVPTVFITAQVPTTLRGTDAFQECDVLSMTAPIVKHAIGVESADEIAPAIHEAFHVARTGRPGPVLVDVPSDLAKAPARAAGGPLSLPGYRVRETPNGAQIRRAAEAIAVARRPVVLAGGGVVHADAHAELTALVRDFDLPVTTTLMALGTVPGTDPRWLGMPGMYGAPAANAALQAADLIVAVGARFDDRVTGDLGAFARDARVVHVDVDAAELGKNVEAHVPVVGDAGLALTAIAARLRELRPEADRLTAWWAQIDGWRARHAAVVPAHTWPLDGRGRGGRGGTDGPGTISAEATLERLDALTGGEATVTTDVGQHQMWAATRLRFAAPRRWLTSGGLGTMGFGLPAAIGAAVAAAEDAAAADGPDPAGARPVVCVSGDGSMLMNLQELATAAELGVPVKVLLFDNASLGMVREQQDTHYAGYRAASLLPGLDWEALGRGFGVWARSIDDPADVDGALEELLAADGPALLRVGIPVEQGCVPAFRAGGAMPAGA
ncbi:biosynthetic-type acetolactate synthase large subunit [Patulibacter americanus]|uniref:biosynthetic-type acetolactate synthase large subunit n=1 Tax=Patulibacter americanus TaxID=588672 RepID=UPI0003B6327B|nr:biosynthetic-type acetolactate synthase large subunit [Patulibacter americanus]